MQKPVWRINTGKGIPNDAEGTVFTPDSIQTIDSYPENLTKSDLWGLDKKHDIYAYQTTRTKSAKYRRVECDWCVNGYELTGISTCDICRKCSGHGFYWEKI